MNEQQSFAKVNSDSGLENLARGILVLTMAIAAALTLVTHIAQITGISFRFYAMIGVCAVIGVLFACRQAITRHLSLGLPRSRAALGLLICCIMGNVLSLISHRPDTDDSLYIPNVVYYLENPDEPMGFDIHFIDSGAKPFVSCHINTSLPFEYAQGVVACTVGVNLLNVYYLVVPAFFGFLVPLGWFYLITRFSFRPRAAVVGTYVMILSVILMGVHHHSFGNFAFNRIFQGKTVMLTIGTALFAALTMDFFRGPSVRRWFYLFLTAVAMVGFTASSCAVIPLSAFVLSIACCVWYVRGARRCLWRGFWYFCHLIYLGIYAVSILLVSEEHLKIQAQINLMFRPLPLTYTENMRLIFTGPAVILFSVLGTFLSVIFLQKRERYFLITWIVLLIFFYLAPVVAPPLMKYVTSLNVYWRLFYLLPIPLLVGLSGAAITLRLESQKPTRKYIIFGAVVAVLVAAHLPECSPSVFRNGTRLDFPRLKVRNLALAQEVLAVAPPAGTMLSLPIVSETLPMLTSKYPQMLARAHGIGIRMFMSQRGPQVEAEHRIRASFMLGEGITDVEQIQSFAWLINQHPQIKSVVARRIVATTQAGYVHDLLSEKGFTESKTTDHLVVFMRSAAQRAQDVEPADADNDAAIKTNLSR